MEEAAGKWVWKRDGGPAPGFGDNTVLGEIEVLDDRLVLDVNSVERLAKARKWIEGAGVMFERATARELMGEDGAAR